MDKSIIKTLCYSEIFSYPLTFEELWKYLLHSHSVRKKDLKNALLKNEHAIDIHRGFIVLKGGMSLIETRTQRSGYSRKKYTKAQYISHILSLIPSVKLVGVSGSLSMNNAKKEDDIDLFIITSKNTLWVTRFLVNSILFLLKEKRSREDRFANDKICTNMFLSEDKLALPKKLRNMYTAHEVAQLKVLVSKDNTQDNFFMKNKWVLNFMPNAYTHMSFTKVIAKKRKMRNMLFYLVEFLFYKLQVIYMSKRITNETVGKNIAMFHPLKSAEAIFVLYDLKVTARTRLLEQKVKHKRSKYAALN